MAGWKEEKQWTETFGVMGKGKMNDEYMGNCLLSYEVVLSLRKVFEAPKCVGTEQ